jgi:putative ABC transport system permease protein
MGIGVAIISLIGNLSKQLEGNFTKSIAAIDMVVGAKGSPLQLILSSVLHIDAPTGNIPLSEIEKLKKNPLVKKLIPMSFGDNYKGYRIIGSNPDFLSHYNATFDTGRAVEHSMEVVLGNTIAKHLNLKEGDTFQSSHGLDAEGQTHKEGFYTVTGILKANGSVIDKLIICNLNSVWNIHDHDSNDQIDSREITAALVKFRSPMGLMKLPRMINENTSMQAALPSIEVNRLFKLFGQGIQIARYLALLIIFISGISVFISLYNSLKEQKNEKALMLSLGASRTEVFLQLMLEGLILSFLGYIFGILLSKIALTIFTHIFDESNLAKINVWQLGQSEIYLFLMALSIGVVSAALPALSIYRINISKTLSRD